MEAHRNRGFTLIELVIVILVVTIGSVTLGTLFGNSSASLSTNEVRQQSTQYAQQCAEHVIATRRSNTFASASLNTTMCDTLTPTLTAPFSRTVAIGATYSTSPCPTGATAYSCKNATVTVAHTALATPAVITIMLVDY